MEMYKFKIKNKPNRFLNQIFSKIDNPNYFWKVIDDEVFLKEKY